MNDMYSCISTLLKIVYLQGHGTVALLDYSVDDTSIHMGIGWIHLKNTARLSEPIHTEKTVDRKHTFVENIDEMLHFFAGLVVENM